VDNSPQALSVTSEFGLPKESPEVLRNFNITYVEPDQAIPDMAKAAFEKIFILSEKGWTLEGMEQDEDIVILRPET